MCVCVCVILTRSVFVGTNQWKVYLTGVCHWRSLYSLRSMKWRWRKNDHRNISHFTRQAEETRYLDMYKISIEYKISPLNKVSTSSKVQPERPQKYSLHKYFIKKRKQKKLYCFYEIKNRCSYMQSILFHCKVHSTCFGCFIHPSLGVQFLTVSTATGTNHSIVSATYSQCGHQATLGVK